MKSQLEKSVAADLREYSVLLWNYILYDVNGGQVEFACGDLKIATLCMSPKSWDIHKWNICVRTYIFFVKFTQFLYICPQFFDLFDQKFPRPEGS